jgi:hypothetical protein
MASELHFSADVVPTLWNCEIDVSPPPVSILGHDGELHDSHLFFFDRYSDLADYHRQQGRIAKADRFAAIAEAYFQAAPDDEPPEAAAMAMPVPRPRTSTNAMSATPAKKPSKKPSSERSHLVPSLTR